MSTLAGAAGAGEAAGADAGEAPGAAEDVGAGADGEAGAGAASAACASLPKMAPLILSKIPIPNLHVRVFEDIRKHGVVPTDIQSGGGLFSRTGGERRRGRGNGSALHGSGEHASRRASGGSPHDGGPEPIALPAMQRTDEGPLRLDRFIAPRNRQPI
jgi:hypothetical protein